MTLLKYENGETVEMTPEEEAEFLASLPPYKPPLPTVISDRQFFQQLAIQGIITQAEALAAVKTGEIPQVMQSIMVQNLNEGELFSAQMLLSGATTFDRRHPLTSIFGYSMGFSDADIDNFFIAASQL